MSNVIKDDLPCPKCPSSDGWHIYDDGHGYCYVCTHYEKNAGESMTEQVEKPKLPLLEDGVFRPLYDSTDKFVDRNISQQACEYYNVKLKFNEDGEVSSVVFPYYNAKGEELVAQKCREQFRGEHFKKGMWRGDASKATLFGMQKWPNGGANGSKSRVTITEGEYDALAMYDIMGKWPAVSIKGGAPNALKDCKENFEWLNSFEEIVICFDADEHGRAAAKAVAELFPIGKAKIVRLTKYKDANEYLMHGAIADFKSDWFSAETYKPSGIISSADMFERLKQVKSTTAIGYPFKELNQKTFGIRLGELVTVTAGTGVGKSAFIKEVGFHLYKHTDDNIGMLMLEESPEKTSLGLMSMVINKPIHLSNKGYLSSLHEALKDSDNKVAQSFGFGEEDKDLFTVVEVTDEEFEYANNEVLASGRFQFFDHFGSNNIDELVSRIYFMVKALNCKYVILDHISIVVSHQQNGDERKALDEIVTKLRTLVQELNFALIIISHLKRPNTKPHEEGGETSLGDLRGTAGIAQMSDMVLGVERNQQHPDPEIRNLSFIRVLKNRFTGVTGEGAAFYYNSETMRLENIPLKVYHKKVAEANAKIKQEKTKGVIFDEEQ